MSSGKDLRSVTNMLVMKGTQLRLVVGIPIFMGAMAITTCLVFSLFVREILPPEIVAQLPSWRVYLLPVIVISFVYCVAGLLYGIYVSHKIVGPIHQLRTVIQRVLEGDTSARVHFRPGDEFLDLGTQFNQLLDKVSRK